MDLAAPTEEPVLKALSSLLVALDCVVGVAARALVLLLELLAPPSKRWRARVLILSARDFPSAGRGRSKERPARS